MLMVFGLIAGIASVSVGRSSSGNAYKEARHLYLQLKLAREDAVLLNRQYGLYLEVDDSERFRYRWLLFSPDNESWNEFNRDGLISRSLPPKIELVLDVENYDVDLRRNRRGGFGEADKDKEITPNILLLSSGEVTPFILKFQVDNISGDPVPAVIIRGNLLGRMQLYYEDDETVEDEIF